MQIVIDISEKMLEWVNDANKFYNDYGLSDFIDVVKNGIPLPKGHGRLIDAEILIKNMKNGINAGLLIDGYEKYTNINSVDDCVFCVECADTVLEADKEI